MTLHRLIAIAVLAAPFALLPSSLAMGGMGGTGGAASSTGTGASNSHGSANAPADADANTQDAPQNGDQSGK